MMIETADWWSGMDRSSVSRKRVEKRGKGSNGIEIMSGAMIGGDVPSKKEKQTD